MGATWAPGSREALPLLVAAAAAVSVGGLVTRWPLVGISLAAALALFAAATRISLLGAVQFLLALLPWMLVFDAFIPPLTRTFVTAAAAAGVLCLSVPLRYRKVLGPASAAVLAATILAHAAGATDVEAFTKLAKFMIFPILAAAVLSKRGQEVLPQVRNVVVASGLAALTVHLLVVTAGLGERGYRYGVGEKIGFGPEIPHELALLAVVMAAAGLSMTERVLPARGTVRPRRAARSPDRGSLRAGRHRADSGRDALPVAFQRTIAGRRRDLVAAMPSARGRRRRSPSGCLRTSEAAQPHRGQQRAQRHLGRRPRKLVGPGPR